jgi:hypothetical protein
LNASLRNSKDSIMYNMTNLNIFKSFLSKQVLWIQLLEIQKIQKNPKEQHWIFKSAFKASSLDATLRNMKSKLVHTLKVYQIVRDYEFPM